MFLLTWYQPSEQSVSYKIYLFCLEHEVRRNIGLQLIDSQAFATFVEILLGCIVVGTVSKMMIRTVRYRKVAYIL